MNKPAIRLLFATAESCPTFRADVASLFGKFLPRFGVASDIVATRSPGVTGEVSWEGGDAFLMVGGGGRARKYLAHIVHCALAFFRADRAKYRAIQVRDMPVVALLGLLAARIRKLRFFYWMSFPMPEDQIRLARDRGLSAGLLRFLFPWVSGRINKLVLYRLLLPCADHVFVQSERMQEDLVGKGITRGKLTPVVMGVDLEVAVPERIAPVDDPRLKGKRVLIYLGSFERPRRIEVLFEMIAILRQQFPDVLLLLVGEAEDEVHAQWLREQAMLLGVADVTVWIGWLPMQEAWRYVRAAEVGLSPVPRGPLFDCGSPTKVMEYLALGVPVVANDNPDQECVLREGGGGLCVPLAPQDFAEAVRRLLNDERLRRSMAHSGQRFVRVSRSYEVLARQVAEKYAELLHLPSETSGTKDRFAGDLGREQNK